MSPESSEGIDFDALLKEIDDEVKARREAGDFPVEMERELDRVFSQYVPVATSGDDLAGLLAAARRASFIDPEPPTQSRIPGVSMLKHAEQRLLGWYFRFLAQQVTAHAHTSTQAIEALAKRVEALTADLEGGSRATQIEIRRLDGLPGRPVGRIVDDVAQHLGAAAGRVLVLEAGAGDVVRLLAARDIDVYGIDSSAQRAAALAADGLDVRDDDALFHLQAVANGALGGLVLAGCVDRYVLDAKVALADLAAEVVAPGAPIAVIGTRPAAWGTDNPVEADLSPGHPLHAATWAHLLEHRGFEELSIIAPEDEPTYVVRGRRSP